MSTVTARGEPTRAVAREAGEPSAASGDDRPDGRRSAVMTIAEAGIENDRREGGRRGGRDFTTTDMNRVMQARLRARNKPVESDSEATPF